MKFACILITNLAVASERRKNIELNNNQLVIFHEENKVKTVIENSLYSSVLYPNLTLNEATYKYPHAVFILADKTYYRKLLNSVADDLLRVHFAVPRYQRVPIRVVGLARCGPGASLAVLVAALEDGMPFGEPAGHALGGR